MDVWQHAYYRDYLKDVKTYTYAMMKELDWDVIEKRFRKADQAAKVKGMFLRPEQIRELTSRYQEILKARVVLIF